MRLAVAAAVAVVAAAPFPHATAAPICGAKTIPFQQSALARSGSSFWLACRDGRRLVELTATGATARTVKLGRFRPWAVVAGGGAVWTISRETPELWKFDPQSGRRVGRIVLDGLPAALWYGAGDVWLGFDGVGFARVDAKTGAVKWWPLGDGVSAFATDGTSVYAVSHRDNAITRISAATGRAASLAVGLADTSTSATEEVAYARGSLWITGRGLDLLRVSAKSGKVQATVEIGPAGLNVVRAGSRLLVASYSVRGARRGDPIVGALLTFDPAANRIVGRATATGASFLSGLALSGGFIYAADTVQGRFVRLTRP
jgi:streptogramin lyase